MENNDDIKIKKENINNAFQNYCRNQPDYTIEDLLNDLFPEAFEESKQEQREEKGESELFRILQVRTMSPEQQYHLIVDLAKRKVRECKYINHNWIVQYEATERLDEM